MSSLGSASAEATEQLEPQRPKADKQGGRDRRRIRPQPKAPEQIGLCRAEVAKQGGHECCGVGLSRGYRASEP